MLNGIIGMTEIALIVSVLVIIYLLYMLIKFFVNLYKSQKE